MKESKRKGGEKKDGYLVINTASITVSPNYESVQWVKLYNYLEYWNQQQSLPQAGHALTRMWSIGK